jgi:hypothetical protein
MMQPPRDISDDQGLRDRVHARRQDPAREDDPRIAGLRRVLSHHDGSQENGENPSLTAPPPRVELLTCLLACSRVHRVVIVGTSDRHDHNRRSARLDDGGRSGRRFEERDRHRNGSTCPTLPAAP